MTGALVPVLAHAGPGSTWQAMVVVAGFALTGVVLAAAFGFLRIESRTDLLMPLAGTAIASSVGVLAHMIISDVIGVGLPLAIIATVTVLLAALTPLDIRFPSPLSLGSIGVSVIACIVLYQPLTMALHPPADVVPLADDAAVVVAAPADGETIPSGTVALVLEVTGGSIGPGGIPLEDLGPDPEEAGAIVVAVEEVREDGAIGRRQLIESGFRETCTLEAPCDRVTYDVPMEPGHWEIVAEFTRGDGSPFAPQIRDRITVEVS